jgi:hypothetical protein
MSGELETGDEFAPEPAEAADLASAPPLRAAGGSAGATAAHVLARAAASASDPPDGPGYLRRLAARSPGERAQVMRALSASSGNRSVSSLVARSALGDAWSSVREFDLGIDIHLPDASDAEKIDWITRNRNKIQAVAYVWESFADPAAAARANEALFLQCAEQDKSLLELDAFDQIRKDFKAAVEAKVTANLNANRNFVAAQMAELGIARRRHGAGEAGRRRRREAPQDAAPGREGLRVAAGHGPGAPHQGRPSDADEVGRLPIGLRARGRGARAVRPRVAAAERRAAQDRRRQGPVHALRRRQA